MNSKITVANLVMAVGAVVTLLFSFFGFYKFGDDSISAWNTDAFAFASAVPAILALAMIIWVACELFGVKMPQDVLTFNPHQIKATWGIAAAGLMLAFATTKPDKSALFWLELLGTFAMAAGSVMALLGKGTETVNLPSSGGNAGQNQPYPPQQPGQPYPPQQAPGQPYPPQQAPRQPYPTQAPGQPGQPYPTQQPPSPPQAPGQQPPPPAG